MTRPRQSLLPGFQSVVDESLPTGVCDACVDTRIHLSVKCHECGMTHCATCDPTGYVTQVSLDTWERLVRACDKLREGGTETETANGGADYIVDEKGWKIPLQDPRSDEEFSQWQEELEA